MQSLTFHTAKYYLLQNADYQVFFIPLNPIVKNVYIPRWYQHNPPFKNGKEKHKKTRA